MLSLVSNVQILRHRCLWPLSTFVYGCLPIIRMSPNTLPPVLRYHRFVAFQRKSVALLIAARVHLLSHTHSHSGNGSPRQPWNIKSRFIYWKHAPNTPVYKIVFFECVSHPIIISPPFCFRVDPWIWLPTIWLLQKKSAHQHWTGEMIIVFCGKV